MNRQDYEAKVISAAPSWVGVPFLHFGRTRSQGVDCLGLILAFFKELGFDHQIKPQGYRPDWYIHTAHERYFDGLMQHCVDVKAMLPGDVLYFRTGLLERSKIRRITHTGIALADRQFLHALTRRPVQISALDDPAWKTTYAGAMRPRRIMELLGESWEQ